MALRPCLRAYHGCAVIPGRFALRQVDCVSLLSVLGILEAAEEGEKLVVGLVSAGRGVG